MRKRERTQKSGSGSISVHMWTPSSPSWRECFHILACIGRASFRPKGSRSGARRPSRAWIEARGLDLNHPEQCRRLPRAPVLDGATEASVRTGPPTLTIFIGLRLNQLGLHCGENGFALGQGQPNRCGRHRIHRSVAGHRLARLHVPFTSVSSSKTRHFISFAKPITTRKL